MLDSGQGLFADRMSRYYGVGISLSFEIGMCKMCSIALCVVGWLSYCCLSSRDGRFSAMCHHGLSHASFARHIQHIESFPAAKANDRPTVKYYIGMGTEYTSIMQMAYSSSCSSHRAPNGQSKPEWSIKAGEKTHRIFHTHSIQRSISVTVLSTYPSLLGYTPFNMPYLAKYFV